MQIIFYLIASFVVVLILAYIIRWILNKVVKISDKRVINGVSVGLPVLLALVAYQHYFLGNIIAAPVVYLLFDKYIPK